MAISDAGRVYGWQALEMQGKPGWTLIRSLKRYLKTAGPKSEIVVDNHHINIGQAITEMMSALRSELLHKSTLGKIGKKDKLQVMLGVPANANTNQRFLTEDAARNAGFEVLGLMNEPSAAALEFANLNTSDRKIKPDSGLLVYDLGGGTFDVSILALGDAEHGVIASDGLADLGGDDFDEILAFLALEHGARPKSDEESLTSAGAVTCCLKNAARRKKLSAQTAASSASTWAVFENIGKKSRSAWTRFMRNAGL